MSTETPALYNTAYLHLMNQKKVRYLQYTFAMQLPHNFMASHPWTATSAIPVWHQWGAEYKIIRAHDCCGMYACTCRYFHITVLLSDRTSWRLLTKPSTIRCYDSRLLFRCYLTAFLLPFEACWDRNCFLRLCALVCVLSRNCAAEDPRPLPCMAIIGAHRFNIHLFFIAIWSSS